MKGTVNILDDSTKSTLFGKFYEKIVVEWFREKGFEPQPGKPRIYWNDVQLSHENSDASEKVNRSLKSKREKQYCIPDGLLKKGNKYYVWEAKNWPQWHENKKPIDQLRDVILTLPFILTTNVVYKKHSYDVEGIFFSWWSKPKESRNEIKKLLYEIENIIKPRTFKIFYTSEIITECIKKRYQWYLDIIKNEKARIDCLFKDLMGLS